MKIRNTFRKEDLISIKKGKLFVGRQKFKFIQYGDPCPICKSLLEWTRTKECCNCGYDKP